MGHIIAVHSASGGAGCTTVAVNLAARFPTHGARSLLIDLSLPYADVGVMLNLRSSATVIDALVDSTDPEHLEACTTVYENGLRVLTAPSHPADADQVTSEQIEKLLTLAADLYDFIVVDVGHHLNKTALTVIDRASVIVLVIMPTLTGVKNARLALDLFKQLAYPSEKIVTVVNHVDDELASKKLNVDMKRIEQYLHVALDARLPNDTASALGALNKGIPPVFRHGADDTSLDTALIHLSDFVFKMLVYGEDETPQPAVRLESSAERTPRRSSRPQSPIGREAGRTISVFIVDEIPETAANLTKLLAFESDFKVVGSAASGMECVEKALRLQPDIILLDATLPDIDGTPLAKRLLTELPTAAIIMMGVLSTVEVLQKAMQSGGRHYLVKPIAPDELYQSIRAAYQFQSATLHFDASPLQESVRHASASTSGLNLRPTPDKNAALELLPVEEAKMSKLPTRGLFSYDYHSGGGSPAPQAAPPEMARTLFSAYYPRQAFAGRKHGLYVYAHVEAAAAQMQQDIGKFKEELGGTIPQARSAKQTAQVAFGTPITITPECEELQFEPASLTKRWRGPFTRFDFDFYPTEEPIDETVIVRVSVRIAGIEVAFIRCGIDIAAESAASIHVDPEDDNPLAAARFASQHAERYQRIFISYSHKDTEVARAYRLAQVAMGNEVFIDVDGLHAGENWQAALARAIDTADIFQLFWSPNYAESEFCRYEWDYALKYRCADDGCESFIRPVYWVDPIPAPPPQELSHLNFKFVPFSQKA
ncbi:MAG: response regulator [Anaerolineae bacterium]|nr:response regulator [Anaerolineae bacterium]NUQ04307.1 response regulator [Anaerolineae bacterium]